MGEARDHATIDDAADRAAMPAAEVQVQLLRVDGPPVDIPRSRVELLPAARPDRASALDALLASRDLCDGYLCLERVLADCLGWRAGSDGRRNAAIRYTPIPIR